MIYIIILAL